ncbi:DivIVA domain-containing protein [Amycolatopsis arida]|uniref:Cell wall synthesis protein Wag31 n=1 Tax=Amycolatopsis arida TaxID=587909 RepID=A0A1I5Q250_9PSEU|nr:DivIVA domain-containing protein [Amycolatopsis arida]TDX98695.1 DivIVA domain-containing protein [Amycolatopsis arida]SFP40444.1 DivIVA domain-containing protein [Amycolatopsis arida]
MAVTVEDVRNIRFERAAIGTRGYHPAEVDAFLDRVVDTLAGEDHLTAADVHSVAFARAPLGKRGYDQAAVDAFLQLVESTLTGLGGPTAANGTAYVAPALEHSHVRKPLWRRVRP